MMRPVRPPNSVLSVVRYAFRLPPKALYAFAGGAARSDEGAVLDPAVAALLALSDKLRMPSFVQMTPAQARQRLRDDTALVKPRSEPMADVEDRSIPGPAGQLRIRIYRPSRSANLPVVMYLHGGGFVVGDLESHDAICRRIARGASAIVVAVDYRLAPENPYPAAVDDAEAAFIWITENVESLGGDPERVAVAGDSAGANLATATCRRLRDVGRRLPKAQILAYPATDLTRSHTSIKTFASGYYLDRPTLDWFMDHYIADDEQLTEPDASPLFSDDLTYLPATSLVTAGFDPLRDEGAAYARALRDSGVDVRYRCEDSMVHGFMNMAGLAPTCDAALERVVRDVRELI